MSSEEQSARNQCLTFTRAGEVFAIGVNRVREVLEYTPVTKVPRTADYMTSDAIEPAPKIGTSVDSEFIAGIGKQGEQFVIVLDVDRVFNEEEVAALSTSGSEEAE